MRTLEKVREAAWTIGCSHQYLTLVLVTGDFETYRCTQCETTLQPVRRGAAVAMKRALARAAPAPAASGTRAPRPRYQGDVHRFFPYTVDRSTITRLS